MMAVRAPVAQLDRAPDFESVGRRFESCRARQPSLTPSVRSVSTVGRPLRRFLFFYAPVAQLDRALASGAKGRRFESCRAHQPPSARVARGLRLAGRVKRAVANVVRPSAKVDRRTSHITRLTRNHSRSRHRSHCSKQHSQAANGVSYYGKLIRRSVACGSSGYRSAARRAR